MASAKIGAALTTSSLSAAPPRPSRNGGTVSETRLIGNGFGRGSDDYWQGIGVQDLSAPDLRANEVRGNAGVGIQYLHAVGGLDRANTVTGNAVNRAAYVAAVGLETASAGETALGRPGTAILPIPCWTPTASFGMGMAT